MNNLIKSILASSLLMSIGFTAQADDTEVYFYLPGAGASVVNPNVVFVFDTSGSMDDEVETRVAYDPTTTYTATADSDSNYIYVYDTNYNYIERIHRDRLQCPVMEAAISVTTPEYLAKSAYWREAYSYSRWWGRTVTRAAQWADVCGSGSSCYFDSADDVECEEETAEDISPSNLNRRYHVATNYHNYLQDDSLITRERKTDVMIDAATALVDDFDGLNFALMRFNGGSGGYVIQDFIDITPAANKTAVKAVISALPASGSTPLSETLYEAMLYLRGDTAVWGNGIGDANAQTSGVYNSGITDACQATHIVYLTDGEPTSDGSSDTAIEALIPGNCSGNCLDELAGYMSTTDLIDDNILEGSQVAYTHTIGFDIDLDLLQDTATAGGGDYYTASDYTELKAAFNSILVSIEDKKDTFVAPAVSVNSYNSLQNNDALYFALFQPLNTPRWLGNLKRYKVDSDGVVTGVDGQPAVNTVSGFFEDSARSWWLPDDVAADGSDVAAGGTSYVMDGTTRTLYTYTGPTTDGLGPDEVDLTLSAHAFSDGNTALTNAMLGLGALDTAGRTSLMDWAVSGDYMGDILHSQPVVVTYGELATTPVSQLDTIFVSTNLGFIHAFDATDGSELFAFAPQEVLENFQDYYENDTNAVKPYGMDGTFAVWLQEDASDDDFIIEPGTTDHVYLYSGMRRGGDHLYALDVTDIQDGSPSPKLKWQINGPVTDPSGGGFTNEFADLGQTWSTPRVGKIKWNCVASVCEDKTVLFFGGGYDTQQDTISAPTADTVGNAIYMVDAETGEKLWSMGDNNSHNLNINSMNSSIPAAVSIGDVDNDGYIDFLFAVDIIGRVWRVDLVENPTGTSGAGFATGGVIAELVDYVAADGDFRRFYSGPDVALFRPRGRAAYLSISVGSGYRAHPNNNDLTDRFYTIFDYNAYNVPASDLNGDPVYQYVNDSGSLREIVPSDLGDASDNYSTLVTGSASNALYGWYKNLDSGEKALSSSITFAGYTIFSTYTPPTANTCGDLGTAKLYVVDNKTGASTLVDDNDDSLPFMTMAHSGIPPEPAIIYAGKTEGTGDDSKTLVKPILCVGTECFGDVLDTQSPLTKSFWRENQ